MRLYLEKNPSQKRAGGVAQGEDPGLSLHSVKAGDDVYDRVIIVWLSED
jgi:hypothetical protein